MIHEVRDEAGSRDCLNRILNLLALNEHLTVHRFNHPRELSQYRQQLENIS